MTALALSESAPSPTPRWQPLSPTIGAWTRDIDLSRPLAPAMKAEIYRAFCAHHVLAFRGQRLNDSHLRDFILNFGRAVDHFIRKADGKPMEAIHTITNLDAAGKPSKRPFIDTNFHWHTDRSFTPVPALMTMLYPAELPPQGGDTEFADMTAAYAALSPDMKRRIDGLEAVQSLEYMRQSLGAPPPSEAEQQAAPPVSHPIARTHPDTGAKSLYIGMYCSHIVGMAEDEGRRLLAELLAHATQEKFRYAHRWQPGDLVIWDNRCLLHRAVANYEMDQHRRVMKRACVEGTRPF
ncbi:MAG: TauD/TfdA family dioxygenase [Alphaproteobacteria bacterium]|nr:TauD/TfdA family dioxygenase [Alphaproteobacteria bacterium]